MREINIARMLAAKRREKGLTQDELAEYIGVSKASVSKWETGQSYPDITLLPALAAYFNISIDELMDYEPQMTGEDIRKLYIKFTEDFSEKPFEEVMAGARQTIKKYYSCFPLLLQMANLLMNYHNLAEGQAAQHAILEESLALCRRIKEESGDFQLCRQANSIEAIMNLMLGRPAETVDLLDGALTATIPDDMTLASAHEARGETSEARRVLQISGYLHLLYLVAAGSQSLPLYVGEEERFEEILSRSLIVADAFHLDTLHPNAFFQLAANAAYCLAAMGQAERSIDMLDRGVRALGNCHLSLILHGDGYYDLIDNWFQTLPLGTNAPRDGATVKASMVGMLEDPVFETLRELPKYKSLLAWVKGLWEN